MTALLRNGQKAEAVDLYGRISKAQVKAGRGAECFSSQAFESAVGYWAKAIEEELAERDLEISERDRVSALAAGALVQANYDPNLDPRVGEATLIEAKEADRHRAPQPTVPAAAAVAHIEEQTEASASAVARAVRFTATEAGAEAGGATPQISEAGAQISTPLRKQSSKPALSSEGSKSQLVEAGKSISRFGPKPNPNPNPNPNPKLQP